MRNLIVFIGSSSISSTTASKQACIKEEMYWSVTTCKRTKRNGALTSDAARAVLWSKFETVVLLFGRPSVRTDPVRVAPLYNGSCPCRVLYSRSLSPTLEWTLLSPFFTKKITVASAMASPPVRRSLPSPPWIQRHPSSMCVFPQVWLPPWRPLPPLYGGRDLPPRPTGSMRRARANHWRGVGGLEQTVGARPAGLSKPLTLHYLGCRRPPQVRQRLLSLGRW